MVVFGLSTQIVASRVHVRENHCELLRLAGIDDGLKRFSAGDRRAGLGAVDENDGLRLVDECQ